ncbi:unnamed protein product [Bursaphelenchus xylophilus]|uniref:(pine wood nematode) hypothetical protein n=1 Tax=Bursaphelenchus xylophilus TaxID=6326 RepID=A0A1I7RIH8_BURXY|nr:unnamed protein product [Bursaphelenchus xylophilus]CAG9080743.1 unnamed protein product [Bursaphelenchus xylophilus]
MCRFGPIGLIDSLIYKWYRAVARNGHKTPATEHIFANFYARKIYVVLHILSIISQISYIILLLCTNHTWQTAIPFLCLSSYILTYIGLFLQKRLFLLPTIVLDSIVPLYYYSLMGRYLHEPMDHYPTLHIVMGTIVVFSGIFQWFFLLVTLRDYCKVEKENEEDDRDCFWEIAQIYLIILLFPLFLYFLYYDKKPECGFLGFVRKQSFQPRGRARTKNREDSTHNHKFSVISCNRFNSMLSSTP